MLGCGVGFAEGEGGKMIRWSSDGTVKQFNTETGQWEEAIPLPYYHGLLPWLWLRLTGYRDAYGRKAQVMWPWEV